MIQIYIDNKLIDLDNTNISLQKEFEDVVENIPNEVEYSYTLSIPASLNNKEIFGFTDTFDVPNKFKRLYDAELYVDETLVLKGKFKVTSIEGGYYKGNIYNPKKQTVTDILGDRNLNEIVAHYKPMNSLDDFDKMNNWVCELSADPDRNPDGGIWNADTVLDNHVVYPYVLYGLPMHNTENIPFDQDIYLQDLAYQKHNINENNVFPAFNVVSVLKDMFKTEGYNLTGNIIDGNMKDFFGGLYQTFQYSYDDYVKNKEVPFYCKVKGSYYNTYQTRTNDYEISPTLEVMDIWSTDSWTWDSGDDVEHDGKFKYGVDNPWSAGIRGEGNNAKIFSYLDLEDEKHMFANGTIPETGMLVIPKSGWYKIKLKGNMSYPWTGNKYVEGADANVGGTTDRADNTTLEEQPFEIQLKKGYPKENPNLYSFFWFTPLQATECVDDDSVAMSEDGNTYIKIGNAASQRRFPKNGGTAIVKDLSGFAVNDFICGARLGGAWFGGNWGPAARGSAQRPNRGMQRGAGMSLPNVTQPLRIRHFESQPIDDPYKAGQGDRKFDGYYLQLASEYSCSNYEYSNETAICLVKDGSYSNFGGYNSLEGSDGNYHWDTTSNFGAVTWEGAETSSAATGDKSGYYKNHCGRWDVNTVVWLEEGDTLYIELLMPYHTGGDYRHSTAFRHSKWQNRRYYVNATDVDYELYVGFLNSNNEWKPKIGDGIKDYNTIKEHKLTNVNQFLPQTKCSDYLEKFLKTFNLQITMADSKTFSIDTINGGNMMTNIIDIEKICNIENAEFKPIKSESIKEYKWKIDQSETGYAQGNQSPHMSGHGESISGSAYYQSGYTGEQQLINDANSSGSIKKTEAPWSYNWYKTIHFTNGYVQPPLTEEYADISVISEADLWRNGMTFAAASDERPKTSKTMRLFTLKKNKEMMDKKYSYISFKHDEKWVEYNNTIGRYKKDMVCNLVLPSNYFETIDLNNNAHRLHLDYTIMDNKFDGSAYNQSLMDVFFNKNVQAGYNIEVPIKLSNEDYAKTNLGTMFKLHDGLYKVKSIEGHDVNKEDDATLTLTTLK